MRVLKPVAIGLARLTNWGLRTIARRPASQLPGRVALALDSDVIADLRGKLLDGSVVVCGTNGKTTTNNVLAAALETVSSRVLCNRAGANMKAGVAAALLEGSWANWAALEVDELSCIHVLPALRPRYLVLLNLFRDQLDRSGEIDHVQDVIVRSLAASPETTLITCGDDPLCMGVALRAQKRGTKVLTFGIGEDLGLAPDRVPEARFCQQCGAELGYAYRSYAQLGAFACPECDFARPELDFVATQVKVDHEGISFAVSGRGLAREAHIEAGFGGVYMVYNLLAAFAVASLVGVSELAFERALQSFDPHNGRLQHFEVEGREVVLNLAKNPTGFNQNISLLLEDERAKQVYFVVNDNGNDGRDISWIWDVDFERLCAPAEEGRLRVLVGGLRANDVQVRMKYAGVCAEAPVAETVDEALALVRDEPLEQPLYVLCNYSALWPVKAELEERGRSL